MYDRNQEMTIKYAIKRLSWTEAQEVWISVLLLQLNYLRSLINLNLYSLPLDTCRPVGAPDSHLHYEECDMFMLSPDLWAGLE